MAGMTFAVETAVHGPVVVVKLIGWLTEENRDELEEQFRTSVDRGCRRFVVDLSSTHFLDRTGLAVFAFYQHRTKAKGGCLILASPSGSARQMILAGSLHKLLPVCETLAEALELAGRKTTSGRWKPVTV